MGNCMAFHIQSRKQISPIIEGEEPEFHASAQVQKIHYGPSKRFILAHKKFHDGEVVYLAPFLTESVGQPLVHCRTTNRRKMKTRKVKIVVTKQQLQLLLSGEKMFRSRNRVIAQFKQSFGLQRCRKWQPSLPTIPEV